MILEKKIQNAFIEYSIQSWYRRMQTLLIPFSFLKYLLTMIINPSWSRDNASFYYKASSSCTCVAVVMCENYSYSLLRGMRHPRNPNTKDFLNRESILAFLGYNNVFSSLLLHTMTNLLLIWHLIISYY